MGRLKAIGLIFFFLGLALLLGMGATFAHTRAFLRNSILAEGRIVGFALPSAQDADGRAVTGRFAIIRFLDTEERTVEVAASTSVSGEGMPGDFVSMRYLPEKPSGAKPDSFGEIWAETLVLAGMGALFSGLGGLLTWFAFRERFQEKRARAYSLEIEARVTEVVRNASLSANGLSPYRIIAQWLNPETNELHRFQSKDIWFDPAGFVGENILIKADARNLKKYWMDVSFLPKVAA